MGRAIRWVIVGRWNLYEGQWITRRAAMEAHTRALGKTWEECRKKGDRAVKAAISWPTR